MCGHGCGESRGREFGWLGVVNVDGSPSQTIFIHHLIRVGDPLDHEWALPSWGQLVGTLGRSGEHEYEASLAVWVGSGRSWGWGHLLVGEQSRCLRASTYVAGSSRDGEAQALLSRSGGKVGSLPLAIMEAEKPWGSWSMAFNASMMPGILSTQVQEGVPSSK